MAQQLDLNHFRELLDKERKRMLRQVREHSNTGEDQSDELSELSDYDDHPADMGTETFMRTQDDSLRENARTTLDRIETAEQKMERGTYGTCDICGQPIPAGRLEAVPYATLCVKCQTDVEGP